MSEHHTEASVHALADAARNAGVCADTRLSLAEIRRREEYFRLAQITFCPECGHRVPFGCEHRGEV